MELKVNVVGFDIREANARKQLEAIAESTGGRYLDARNPQELLSSLKETLHFEFAILNEKEISTSNGSDSCTISSGANHVGRYVVVLNREIRTTNF